MGLMSGDVMNVMEEYSGDCTWIDEDESTKDEFESIAGVSLFIGKGEGIVERMAEAAGESKKEINEANMMKLV